MGTKNNLRKIRKSMDVTLEKLSEDTGISTTHLSRMETGDRGIKLEYALLIAEALGVDAGEFTDLENGPSLRPGKLDSSSSGKTADCIPVDVLRIAIEEIARNYDYIDAEPIEFAHAVTDYCLMKLKQKQGMDNLRAKP